MLPHLAINLAAGFTANVIKYSNITDMSTNQYMLTVDNALLT